MTRSIAYVFGHSLNRLAAGIAAGIRRRRDRRDLLTMSIRELKDIGLRPEDVWLITGGSRNR
jgi:uncharacterized protein YjiS (DUF1127 family)